jgi:hypothetical protein
MGPLPPGKVDKGRTVLVLFEGILEGQEIENKHGPNKGDRDKEG